MFESWLLLGTVGAFLALVVLVWRPARAAAREAKFARARRVFHTQRERLEAKFVQLASAHAAANGPRWADCDFDDDVAYVRNRSTKELAAFVEVSVAVDDLEPPSAGFSGLIDNRRVGTAVFRFDRDHWVTDGRAILNFSPSEAIHYYCDDLEVVGEELAHHRS